MTNENDIARAIAFFQQCEDLPLLRRVLEEIRPRASAEVRRYLQRDRTPPPPRDIAPAASPAGRDEALQTVKATKDFAELQAIARAVGQKIETLSA
jgi:hypothetical protein